MMMQTTLYKPLRIKRPCQQNNDSLKHMQVRLRHLIENMQGGILLENEHRAIELINQTFCDMFHIPVPPQTLIGTDCSQSAEQTKHLFANPEQFVERIGDILSQRQPALNEIVHFADGRVFERDYVPIQIGKEYLGHLWHYRDVTGVVQVRRRWERLLQLEQFHKEVVTLFLQSDDVDSVLNHLLMLSGQLMDVSRVYVFHFRENERILDNTHEWCAPGINPEIDNLKGLPFDEMLPSFFPLLTRDGSIAPRHINELPADVRAILEPQNVQTVLILPLYSGGRIEGFIGFDETRQPRQWLPEEITTVRIIAESYARALEQRHTQAMLVEARDAALRTAQLKSQFMSNMSHEIRTPMTGVLGMLELLRETLLDEEQVEFADAAYDSARHLLNIINDILDFSKLEAGRVILEAESIDLRDIATEIKTTLLSQAIKKSLRLKLEIAPDVPQRVIGDPTRLRQVLMNFFSNAVKFTHAGSITLVVQQLSRTTDLSRIRFEVKDTGIGITPEQQEQIFQSFMQADGTITRKFGGTGLGLAISKQLVELMGGAIGVESESGKGSAFSFVLNMPVDEHGQNSLDPLSHFAHVRALVVDEEKTARYVLAQQLQMWGVYVAELSEIVKLPGALQQAAESGLPFDAAFVRCNKSDLEKQQLLLSLRHAVSGSKPRLFVRVTDTELPQTLTDTPFDTALIRPIRQSDLYNLLFQISDAAVPVVKDSLPTTSHNLPEHARILLAEDYEQNVHLVQRALSGLSAQIDVVDNGQAVLEQLEQHTYNLVLMDMHMPIMDGREATRRIRSADALYRDIPIIALTASVMKEQQDEYFLLGVNAVVGKPFSVKHLVETVKGWLEAKEQPL